MAGAEARCGVFVRCSVVLAPEIPAGSDVLEYRAAAAGFWAVGEAVDDGVGEGDGAGGGAAVGLADGVGDGEPDPGGDGAGPGVPDQVTATVMFPGPTMKVARPGLFPEDTITASAMFAPAASVPS